jgi:N-formylglutamate deformylase
VVTVDSRLDMRPDVTIGNGPIVLAQPHGGIEIPETIYQRLNPEGQARADTDWHISRLYAGLLDETSIVSTPIHRYVIDANRDPADESLYPGQNTTSLCPATTFDGAPIYLDGQVPSADEIGQRQRDYHQPYHDALREQLERIRQKHGYVILYDCHSIRSIVPYLFAGQLPDFNIGTNCGSTCDASIEQAVERHCHAAAGYRYVLNGRFKGGWTTRHYGQPQQGYHALQMELAQCNYMQEETPWQYDAASAHKLRAILAGLLTELNRTLA